MVTRLKTLALVAGTLGLAGCGGSGGNGGGTDDGGGPGLDVEAFDVSVAPGGTAAVEVQATSVETLTWSIADLPEGWPVTYGSFDPEPTAVQESYPETLVWDPAVDDVSGTLSVAVADDATPDSYTFPVEAGNGDEQVVSEATITVEG
jgi:hypothetical protein